MTSLTRRAFVGALGAFAAPALSAEFPSGREVNLLAMGDWGAPPHTKDDAADAKRLRKSQDGVAAAMADYASRSAEAGSPIDAVLPMGDNFYAESKKDGLKGPDDTRFKTRFEDLYPKAVLDVPFYFALGNHDYEDGDDQSWKHQIDYARSSPTGRWQFPAEGDATWYRRDFPVGAGLLSLFVLDTNTDHVKSRWNDQITWLEKQLNETQGNRWKMVMAHHPMFTDGYHWDGKHDKALYPLIRKTILSKLKDVVFYVSAHDHNQQHIHDHPDYPHLDFLVSGAGGGAFPQKRRATDRPYKNEFMANLGFLHLRFTDTEAVAHFIAVGDKGWKIQHTVTRV